MNHTFWKKATFSTLLALPEIWIIYLVLKFTFWKNLTNVCWLVNNMNSFTWLSWQFTLLLHLSFAYIFLDGKHEKKCWLKNERVSSMFSRNLFWKQVCWRLFNFILDHKKLRRLKIFSMLQVSMYFFWILFEKNNKVLINITIINR